MVKCGQEQASDEILTAVSNALNGCESVQADVCQIPGREALRDQHTRVGLVFRDGQRANAYACVLQNHHGPGIQRVFRVR
jgi:hypothetical protein